MARGSVTVQNLRQPRAPTLRRLLEARESIFPSASTTSSVIIGNRWSVSTKSTPQVQHEVDGLHEVEVVHQEHVHRPRPPQDEDEAEDSDQGGEMIGISVR